MASPTQWTWVWLNSESWRWTGRPGMLQPLGSQRVRHNWATELNWVLVEAHGSHMRDLTVASGVQFANQGLNPRPPALGAQSPNHWTTREVLGLVFLLTRLSFQKDRTGWLSILFAPLIHSALFLPCSLSRKADLCGQHQEASLPFASGSGQGASSQRRLEVGRRESAGDLSPNSCSAGLSWAGCSCRS